MKIIVTGDKGKKGKYHATDCHHKIKDSSFHGYMFFLRLENVFDSGSILEMAAAGSAAPYKTFTQT